MDLKKIPNGNIWRSSKHWFLEGRYDVDIQDTLFRSAGEYAGRPLESYHRGFDTTSLFSLPEHDDYAIARSLPGRDPRYVLLVAIDGESRKVVGGLDSWGLYVDEAHRGKGLGGWLAWAGMSLSGEMTTDYGLYSAAGYAAFSAAHRIALDIARAEGRNPPDQTADEYPVTERDPEFDDGEADGWDF
ncbi:hypothetical protein G6L37_02520 [Agrobacterium rubi]|nr:hypothetical protein [Agrobacterium rubi]NTF24270.1 hypothetical protein [Agrobacterium rubi]